MENKENEETREVLEKLRNVHYLAGPIQQKVERMKAQLCMKSNELEAIYHLVESHIPGLRQKTVLRYETILTSVSSNVQLSLNKNHVSSKCTISKVDNNVSQMLERIREMPSEWTLVQLTPHFHDRDKEEVDLNIHHTMSLYLTVFNCGKDQPDPFCINIEAPHDVTGAPVQLMNEIHSIMEANKATLSTSKVQTHFRTITEKQSYFNKRQSVDDRLKMIVKDLQNLYLKEWRCFLIGKYVDCDVDRRIHKQIKEFFKAGAPDLNLSERNQLILKYLIKSANYLKLTELKRAIQTIIPDDAQKRLRKSVIQFVRRVSEEYSLSEQDRHPLILIIDDSLDYFPWEMIDILSDISVSRLPSLHLVYALFQEHKETIKNGFKIITNTENGSYVVNADGDLKSMESRIISFYDYWLPSWKGFAGHKPDDDHLEKMLMTSDIFAYNGHGSGAHLFPMHRIEKIRINAVIFLFGCSSTKLSIVGPRTEMYSAYQVYLIACSPCIIGNLWEVTDLDTDVLTTDLLSHWIPNCDKIHWKNLDVMETWKWKKGEKVAFGDIVSKQSTKEFIYEPELLKALSAAKKSSATSYFLTKAAIVARGIPVKLVTK